MRSFSIRRRSPKMTLTFSSPADLAANFRYTVIVGAVLILVLVAAVTKAARASPYSMSFGARCIIGMAAFIAVLWYAYASSYRQFVSLTLDPSNFHLLYAGPFHREVTVPRLAVTEVRFGSGEGRGSSTCRISIEVQQSQQYFSGWIPDRSNDCRNIRDEIRRELRP
jgi:hypothetical protein